MLLACSVLCSEGALSADCSNTDYDLGSQAEVDALGAEGCDTITGSLVIGGYATDLSSLVNLTSIGGDLELIFNPYLTNVDGLENIGSVGGDLRIWNNDALANIDGLASIASVGGALYIEDNDTLADLDGLSNTTSVLALIIVNNDNLVDIDGMTNITIHVDGRLAIIGNDSLTNIDALANIASAGGIEIRGNDVLTNVDGLGGITGDVVRVEIQSNPALTDVDGLANVGSVYEVVIRYNSALSNLDGLANVTSAWYVLITNNSAITNIDGLFGITSIGRSLRLSGNSALTNVDGLASITCGSDLSIVGNDSLANVDGLANVTSVGLSLAVNGNGSLTSVDGLRSVESIGGSLEVLSNGELADCEALALVLGYPGEVNFVSGTVDIGDNAVGCGSAEEILATVVKPSLPQITQVIPGNERAEIYFAEPISQSDVFPVIGFGTYCTGKIRSDTLNFSVGSEQAIPETGASRSVLTISDFGPATAGSSLIIRYIIEHERTDLLTLTLVAPSGNRYVLRSNTLAPENKFGEYFRVDPVEIAQSYDDSTNYYYGTAPGDISALTSEIIDGVWELEIFNEGGPVLREGKIYEFGISIRETPAIASTTSPVTLTNLINDREYSSCLVVPKTRFGIEFEMGGDSFSVTPTGTRPVSVTIFNVEFEDGRLEVDVSVADDGGYPIEKYDVQCDGDDGSSLFGSSGSSPISLAGAKEGVSYTCVATASNSKGGTSSPASPPYTAEEQYQQGLPIWLLYEASQ